MTNFYEDMRKSLNAKKIPDKALSAFEIAQTKGFNGNEIEWLNSLKGNDGLSAWEVAIAKGYNGSEDDWLKSLQGRDGRSAYLVWRDIHGGTAEEFVASMKGLPGKRGDSAYEIWKRVTKSNGAEKDFIDYLKGEPGDTVIYAPTFIISDDGDLIMEVNGERQNLGKVRPDFAAAVSVVGGDIGASGSGSLRIVNFFATGSLPLTGKSGIIYVERGVGAFAWDAENASMVSIAGGASITPPETTRPFNPATVYPANSSCYFDGMTFFTTAGAAASVTTPINALGTAANQWRWVSGIYTVNPIPAATANHPRVAVLSANGRTYINTEITTGVYAYVEQA